MHSLSSPSLTHTHIEQFLCFFHSLSHTHQSCTHLYTFTLFSLPHTHTHKLTQACGAPQGLSCCSVPPGVVCVTSIAQPPTSVSSSPPPAPPSVLSPLSQTPAGGWSLTRISAPVNYKLYHYNFPRKMAALYFCQKANYYHIKFTGN